MKITPIKSQKFQGGENLFQIFLDTNTKLRNGAILSISSKILALSQGRLKTLSDYSPDGKEAFEMIIKEEADKIYPGKYTLTLKENILIPFSGIDASNVPNGQVVLWPEEPYKAAKEIHAKLCEHFQIQELGILITDSRCTPLRIGVTGLALTWYGFEGVEDERGEEDLFGKKLQVTQKAVADNLASTSILIQGEGNECTPFSIIENAPVNFEVKDDFLTRSHIDPEEDIFAQVMSL